MKKYMIILLIVTILVRVSSAKTICIVYFTGIGCPHCAKTDPVILNDILKEYENVVVLEYEIYHQNENAKIMWMYDKKYSIGFGIPLIVFGKERKIVGDIPIITNIRKILNTMEENPCLLLSGEKKFEELDISELPGYVKIWKEKKVIVKENKDATGKIIDLLNIEELLKNKNYNVVDSKPMPISGKWIEFENAVKIDNILIEWNGEPKAIKKENNKLLRMTNISQTTESTYTNERTHLTLTKIVSLAIVDAINPCALAVLTLMLIAIMTYNPKDRKKVLFSGISFTLSVYIIYLFYGLVIIKFFQIIQTLVITRIFLYKLLSIVAIILGLFNIKDFVRYKPGGLLTEMPIRWRPKVKKVINKITSPWGAFAMGTFVTIFLLPCTIGPYIIAGGMLFILSILETIPWLLLYNFIFVLPMICITLIIYMGIRNIKNVSQWRDRNIRYLHLIAGIIMFILGFSMFFGII